LNAIRFPSGEICITPSQAVEVNSGEDREDFPGETGRSRRHLVVATEAATYARRFPRRGKTGYGTLFVPPNRRSDSPPRGAIRHRFIMPARVEPNTMLWPSGDQVTPQMS